MRKVLLVLLAFQQEVIFIKSALVMVQVLSQRKGKEKRKLFGFAFT